ncbi:MAG: SDR family NAD(P)-dependent oxidoreductase, partial [Pseudomonadota bacterium]
IDLTKRVLPIMIAQKSGHIAVTSSVAGKIGAQLRTGYCAAKHAMQGFFDALRAEVASEGIHVTSILPGFVRTEISKNAMRGDGTAFGVVTDNVEAGMDVDAAAGVMAKGLRAKKAEIPVGTGREMNLLWLKRLAPGLVRRITAKVQAAYSRRLLLR